MTAHSPGPNGNGNGNAPGNGGRADKRERILDAAERVFAEHGFFNTRVAEIAKVAGVADGTIYLYFKSKDDLLISLFESRMERVIALLVDAMAAAPTAPGKVMAFVRTYLELVRDQPNVAEVLTIELRQSSKFMKEYANPRFADLLKLVAGAIADGQAAGELDASVPPQHAARMIFGIIDELALAWLLGRGEKFDIVRAADWVGALVMRGLERRSIL
jgi:TetR/AcrR family transcriptional regulator, fatty acid metabolism regulator protein